MNPCPHCNAPLVDNASFCHACGKSVETKAPVPAKESTATSPVSISTVLGLASLASGNVYAAFIMSIFGVVFGKREKMETGRKAGYVMNVIALVNSAIGIFTITTYLTIYFSALFIAIADTMLYNLLY